MTLWAPQVERFSGPKYRALADCIESDFKAGKIPAGFQLPTHRELADQLGVTVGTITRGYAEAARRGLIRGETGRGTFIGGPSRTTEMFSDVKDIPKDAIDMGMTLPLNHLDPNLSETFSKLSQKTDLQSSILYTPSTGRQCDREVGVEWLKHHHIQTKPENILLTAGGQHALTVLLSTLFRPGDTLAVERITYPLIKSLARRFSLRITPIDIDEQGMVPESLDAACKTQNIHGIYCMPTIQNPTTAVMGEGRRMAIGDIARKHNLFILEDDAYATMWDESYTPIAVTHPERSFYIASISKSITSGLRFGYIVSPSQQVKRIQLAIADTLWMASPLAARIFREWVEDGTAVETIQKKQQESRLRNQISKSILGDHTIKTAETGYFVWLELPDHWNATDFAKQASEKLVIVTPLEHYLVGRQRPENDAVRIAISGAANHNDLKRGLEVIKHLLVEPSYLRVY